MTNHFVRRLAVAPIVIAALCAATTRAQAPAATQPPVNVAACQTCHGREGVSASGGIPNLAGQKAAYLEAQLKAFHSGDRKNSLMNAIAGQLGDGDIHELAAYWSSLPAAPQDAHGQVATSSGIASRMTFPANFPAGFTVYQSVTADGAVTKRYANVIALKAAGAGKPLPDGSVIMQVSYEETKDAAGAVVAGAAKSYAGMESRAGWGKDIPALLRNEDWDYAVFTPDKVRRDTLNQAQCLACHKPAQADSYVFTMKDLREKAKP